VYFARPSIQHTCNIFSAANYKRVCSPGFAYECHLVCPYFADLLHICLAGFLDMLLSGWMFLWALDVLVS
jgi:hypothetical protein